MLFDNEFSYTEELIGWILSLQKLFKKKISDFWDMKMAHRVKGGPTKPDPRDSHSGGRETTHELASDLYS